VVCILINLDEEVIEELMQDAIFFREKGKAEKGEEKLKILKTIFLEKRGMKVYNEKF